MHTDAIRTLLTPPAQTDRFYGVVVGVVTNNQDPESMHRVKVRFPWLSNDVESNWARVATPMAGNGRGAYFLPEVDDEVLVAFEHGRVDHPYVLGSLWNGQDVPPESNDNGENNHRTIQSRSGHVVRLNDATGSETIEIIDKSGNNKIVINTAENSITIEADADIKITSATGKLTMEANGIEMKSQAGITVQAAQSMDLTASMQVTVKGATIHLN
jgi:uncharacterized protein involved in type VI secretion and phage assembly